jgi:hypothetical protein
MDLSIGMLNTGVNNLPDRSMIDFIQADISSPFPLRSSIFEQAISVGVIHYLASDVDNRNGQDRLGECFQNTIRCCIPTAMPVYQFFPIPVSARIHFDHSFNEQEQVLRN